MGCKFTFERQEIKYIISKKEKEDFLKEAILYLKQDEYGRFKVCNVYFDTSDYLIARRSIDKPLYKEKLRIRSYGMANQEDLVFLELKKKYDSIVYKRRIHLPCKDAFKMIASGCYYNIHNQIEQEIRYFCQLYGMLIPSVYLSYQREAYYAFDDPALRITFDDDILWRNYDFIFNKDNLGYEMLKDEYLLLEIKAERAMPVWLSRILSQNGIYPSSFSKYGNAYKSIIGKGDIMYAG